MKRALRNTLIVLVLLVVAGFIAARWYLTSDGLAQKVASELEALYGAPVKIGEVDVWLASSSLSGLELFEEGGEKKPWLTAEEVQTDLSVFDFLNGNSIPGDLKLKGVNLVLRFDEQGKLITRIPEKLFQGNAGPGKKAAVPHMELENCQVTLRQGERDLVLRKIQARLEKKGERLQLTGATENPEWGAWNIEGNFDQEGDKLNLRLKSQGSVRVTQAMLSQIPFIPPSVWEAVQFAEGKTPGTVDVGYDLKNQKVHYRVALEPSETRVKVPAIELEATQARGKVTVEDGLVQLRDVQGNAFLGAIRTDADLDFRTAPTRLHFSKIEVREEEGLDVSLFPKSWKFPPKITGKLVGGAALLVTLVPEEASPSKTNVLTEGRGKGKILNAKVAGFPAAGPIELELHPVLGGYRFASGAEVGLAPAPGAEEALLALFTGTSVLLPPEGEAPSAGLMDSLFLAAQEKVKDPPKKKESSTFDIDLKMKDLDLGKFAKELEFKLPFEMVGKLSFQVKVSIPLDDTADLKKYKVHGAAQVSDFVLGDLKLDHLETEIVFDEGLLRMPTLKGRMPADSTVKDGKPGTFEGTGSLQVEPWGDLKVDLKVERIPLSQVAKLSGSKEPVQGDVSGTLAAQADAKDLKNFALWKGSATLSSQRVLAFGWNLVETSAEITLAKGELILNDFRAKLEGAPILASAQVRLEAPYPFTGKVKLQDANLNAIERLVPKWRPPLSIAGNLQTEVTLKGTAYPLKLSATGTTSASDLKIEQFSLKDAQAFWELDNDRLNVTKFQARLYEGEVTGSAVLPLRPEVAGSVELNVKGLDAATLSKDIPDMPLKVLGKVDGQLKGKLSPAGADKERPITVHLDLKAPKMRVQPPGLPKPLPTEELKGFLEYKDGDLDFKLEGKFLGSPFELLPRRDGEKKAIKKAHFHIKNLQIGRLLESVGVPEAGRFYQGSISVELDFTLPPSEDWPEGTGRLRLSNLRYKDAPLGGEVAADLILAKQQLRVREISTTFGEGIIRAQLAINFKRFDRSWFSINLDRVEAAQLLGPWLGDTMIKGPLQARIRGRLGREWTGTADLEMTRGSIGGLEITQLHMPLTFRFAPAEGHGQVEVHDLSAHSGPGRLTGKFTLAWDYAMRLEGQLRFSRVSVESLLKQSGGPSAVAGGLMTGHFTFMGREMRSLNDLSGTLDASFEQSQALEVPVLKQISPFLGVTPTTTFQKGEIRARLSDGALRIHALALEGPNLKLFIEGTVSLLGRLDLDVMASTVNFGLDPRLRLLGLRIPIAGPIPLIVAQEVATILSNRVIHIRVTGTIRSPSIRVFPLASVTQGAVRYFLNRSVGYLPFGP